MNKRVMKYLMPILALLASTDSMALLSSGHVRTLTGEKVIAHNQPTSVNLQWSVVTEPARLSSSRTVSSSEGHFFDVNTGRVLWTVAKPLVSKPLDGAAQTVVLLESLTVPMDLVSRVYQDGGRQIGYRRDFTDCPSSGCGTLSGGVSVIFSLGGSMAGAPQVKQLSLRFDDDSVVLSLEKGRVVRAHADVTLTRAGLLRAAWEIASPAANGASPRFETVQLVNRYVTGKTRIESPPLPTDLYGGYQLRLRLIEPPLSADTPVIRYFVIAPQATEKPEVAIQVRAPVDDALVSHGTKFEWGRISGAVAYKLVFVGEHDDTVIAGFMVDGETDQAHLPPTTYSHLSSGRAYRWRVQALAEDGTVIGAAPWQRASMAREN